MAQILLVEDEADLRDNLELVLSHAGHRVLTAGNGREALAVIEETPPDLVVSDISMPEMTGLQLLTRIRQEMPQLADMPVILLTALGDREHVIEGRELGADDYLTKPVDFDLLSATIAARLSRLHQADSLKDRQFVRLFKGLTGSGGSGQGIAGDASACEASRSPLVRIAAMADPSLRGRVQALFPEDFIRDYAAMAASTRDKILNVMRRIVESALTPEEVRVDFADGTTLLVLAEAAGATAEDRFTLLRMRLRQALDAGHQDPLEPDGTGDQEEESDGGDLELKQALRDHYFAHPSAAQDGRRDRMAEPVAFEEIAGAFAIDFQPIWDNRTRGVDAFLVGWQRRLGGTLPLRGERALMLGNRDPLMCDLVALAMNRSVQEIMIQRGQHDPARGAPAIVLPLPLPALRSLSAYKIERQLDDIRRLLDRRRVGFHLTGADEEISPGFLRKLHAVLSSAGATIVVDLDGNRDRVLRVLDLGFRTLHLDATARVEGLSAEQSRMMLLDDVAMAAQAGFEVWVSGIGDPALGKAGTAAGALLLSGDAIGRAGPAPVAA